MQTPLHDPNGPARTVSAAVTAALMMLVSCSGAMPPVKSVQAPAGAATTLTVTPSDNQELAGTELVVPAGALAGGVNLTVTYQPQSIVTASGEAAGPVAQFGPVGTQFAVPARLTLPVRLRVDQSPSRLYVDVLEGTGERARIEGASLTFDATSSSVSFEVAHFTSFQAGVRADENTPVAPDDVPDASVAIDAGTQPPITPPAPTEYPAELRLNWDNQLQPLGGEDRSFTGVWSSSDAHLFMVDGSNWITRRVGTTWSRTPTNAAKLGAIWGTSSTDVWAVGEDASTDGVVCHFDGTAWTCESLPQTGGLRAIWGSSSTNAWAVGQSGTIVRLSGGTWSQVSSPTSADLLEVHGSSASNVWTVSRTQVFRFSGSVWEPVTAMPNMTAISSVWTAGPTATWIVENNNVGDIRGLWYWNGSTWTNQIGGHPDKNYADIRSVWGSTSNDVWFGAEGTFFHWNGASLVRRESPSQAYLYACHGTSTSSGWCVGERGVVLNWNGSLWQDITGTEDIRGISGSSSSDVWAVGFRGLILHSNGNAWTPFHGVTNRSLNAVWAANTTNAWAVGVGGTVLKWNGSQWQPETVPTQADLWAVHGTNATDVWASGANGTLLHLGSDGAWRTISSGTNAAVMDLWAKSPTEAWAVCVDESILRWNGSAWSVERAATRPDGGVWGGLVTAWGTGNFVWAGGGAASSNRILGRNPTNGTWTNQPSFDSRPIADFWGNDATNIWVVNDVAQVSQWNGSQWVPVTLSHGMHFAAKLSIWVSPEGDVWLAGAWGRILKVER